MRNALIASTLLLAACGRDGTGPSSDGRWESPDTLAVIGHGVVSDRYTSEVAVRGAFAYTSTWGNRTGLPGNVVHVWNVSGAAPALVNTVELTGARTTGDVQISDDGRLLVVATEGQGGSIGIYDRTEPAAPRLLARWSSAHTQPGVHTVKLGRVDGRHYAFLSVNPGLEGARLVIVDITNPEAPSQVWTERMGRPYVHDVFVRDGWLYTALWEDGLAIWDIGGGSGGGSPSNPIRVGSVTTETGNIHNIWWFHDPTTGSKRYVFLGEEGPGGLAGGVASGDIHVIDISNRRQPREVAVFSVPGAGVHNFWMDEARGILYAAYYNGGVRAVDVRGDLGGCTAAQRTPGGLCDLRLMKREAGVALAGGGAYVWGVVYQDGFVYASDMRQGLYKLAAVGSN